MNEWELKYTGCCDICGEPKPIEQIRPGVELGWKVGYVCDKHVFSDPPSRKELVDTARTMMDAKAPHWTNAKKNMVLAAEAHRLPPPAPCDKDDFHRRGAVRWINIPRTPP